MDISEIGRVVVDTCRECTNEALSLEWKTNRPDWLREDDDGDLVILSGSEWGEWTRRLPRVNCLLVENVEDFSRNEIFRLCPTHLVMLSEMVRQAKPQE